MEKDFNQVYVDFFLFGLFCLACFLFVCLYCFSPVRFVPLCAGFGYLSTGMKCYLR